MSIIGSIGDGSKSANLMAIMEYVEKDSAERAKSFALEIQSKTNSLADFPGMGRPGRVIGTRELEIHPNYIIPYRIRDKVVEVLRVQHVGWRWPRRLQVCVHCPSVAVTAGSK